MWTIAFFVGILLGGVVFLVGYGQVLLYNLFLRSLLVTLGSALTIIAARKATTVFISPPSSSVNKPPELGEVEINEPAGEGEETESPPADDEGATAETGEATSGEEASSGLDDEADIGELADMVSETMKDEEE